MFFPLLRSPQAIRHDRKDAGAEDEAEDQGGGEYQINRVEGDAEERHG